MKFFLTAVFTLLTCICFAQTISYKDWNKQAKTDIRLLPKYGNKPKSERQKLADQELIDAYVAQEGSRRKASEFLIDIGFQYLASGDIKTAMSRFNQAWLLDPENEDTFWGWGSVYFSFDDIKKAMEQYNEGLSLNPNNPRLLTDKATIYMGYFRENKDPIALKTAIELFLKSYTIDNKNQNTIFKLSVAYFESKDCDNAWKFYDLCKELGGKPISSNYTAALKEECRK